MKEAVLHASAESDPATFWLDVAEIREETSIKHCKAIRPKMTLLLLTPNEVD
jgi:hypothetical protein